MDLHLCTPTHRFTPVQGSTPVCVQSYAWFPINGSSSDYYIELLSSTMHQLIPTSTNSNYGTTALNNLLQLLPSAIIFNRNIQLLSSTATFFLYLRPLPSTTAFAIFSYYLQQLPSTTTSNKHLQIQFTIYNPNYYLHNRHQQLCLERHRTPTR